VSRHGKRRAALRCRNRWNQAFKEQSTKKTTPHPENQSSNNGIERNNIADCPWTSNNFSNNSDNSQNHDPQDTLPSPSYSPVSSPEPPRSPSLPVRERTPPIPVITLDSDPPSLSVHDHSNSSEIGEALEDFARDLPDLDEDSRN